MTTTQSTSAFPWSQTVDWLSSPGGAAAVALAVGFVLLFAGGRLLRFGLVLGGLGLGGVAGLVLAERFFQGGSSPVPGAIMVAVACLAGMSIGFASYRLAVCVASTAVLAGVGLAAAGVAVAVDSPATWRTQLTEAREHATAATGRVRSAALQSMRSDFGPGVRTRVAGAAKHTADAAREATRGELSAAWGSISPDHRLWLLAGGAGGGVVGLALGAFAPRRASGLATAAVGAAACLAGGAYFAGNAVSLAPAWWIAAGAGLTAIGAGAQMATWKKPALRVQPQAA